MTHLCLVVGIYSIRVSHPVYTLILAPVKQAIQLALSKLLTWDICSILLPFSERPQLANCDSKFIVDFLFLLFGASFF